MRCKHGCREVVHRVNVEQERWNNPEVRERGPAQPL